MEINTKLSFITLTFEILTLSLYLTTRVIALTYQHYTFQVFNRSSGKQRKPGNNLYALSLSMLFLHIYMGLSQNDRGYATAFKLRYYFLRRIVVFSSYNYSPTCLNPSVVPCLQIRR